MWGNNPDAVKSLNAWLLKQHITLVDDVKISEIANDINLPQPMSSTAVLRVAKIAGIEQVIFVDTNVSPLEASFFGHPSAYNASLFIRGLNVETAEIDWNGNARSTQPFTNLTDGIHQLACHALATAWGLQKPGTSTATSVCLSGQDVMVSNEAAIGPRLL